MARTQTHGKTLVSFCLENDPVFKENYAGLLRQGGDTNHWRFQHVSKWLFRSSVARCKRQGLLDRDIRPGLVA